MSSSDTSPEPSSSALDCRLLVRRIDRFWAVVTDSSSVSCAGSPVPVTPAAVAVLSTDPASTSVCVTV